MKQDVRDLSFLETQRESQIRLDGGGGGMVITALASQTRCGQ